MASKSLPSIRSDTDVSNSSDREQQAHPFCSSTVPQLPFPTALPVLPSPLFIGFEMSLASILTLATSFTIVPTLIPSVFSNNRFNAVVLPAPRNPDRMVIGILAGVPSASSVCFAFSVVADDDICITALPSPGVFLAARIICADVAATMPAPTKFRFVMAWATQSEAVNANADCGKAPMQEPTTMAGGIALKARVATPLMTRLAIAEEAETSDRRLLLQPLLSADVLKGSESTIKSSECDDGDEWRRPDENAACA
mmetsp:Transcript_21099/g.44517  ORF Transcript_21099/g.44517 Transcript_21099/m.44517 type:complete len:255 (-) Transcript_21099:225-989(-)